MTCNEIEKRLPAYMEVLLSTAEKKVVEEHLSACAQCRGALSDLEQTEKLVKGLEEVEPPPFFEQRIMSQIRKEAGQKKGFLRKLFYPLYVKVPVQALAVVLVAVLGFYVFQRSDPEMKQTATLLLPRAESGKPQVPAEPPQVSAVPKPAPASPAPEVPARSPGQFATPPPGTSGTAVSGRPADRSTYVQAPPAEGRLPGSGSVAPALQKEEKNIPGRGGKTSGLVGDRAEKTDSGRYPEALRLEQKRRGRAAEPGAWTGENRKMAAPPAPSRLAEKAVAARPDVELTVEVADMSVALKKIEELLVYANARNPDRERREGKALLRAEIPPDSVATFLDRLEGIGRVRMERKSAAVPDRHVTTRIEIIDHP